MVRSGLQQWRLSQIWLHANDSMHDDAGLGAATGFWLMIYELNIFIYTSAVLDINFEEQKCIFSKGLDDQI